MPDTVALSGNISDAALWVTNLRLPPFVQGQTINWNHFRHKKGIFAFLVSILGFSCMPDIVVLSENIFDIALWVKNPRWPPFVQGQTINWYYFWHNRGIFAFLASILGLLCMPDIVVLSENIFDIVLWVKNSRWPPFGQGQTINEHHFLHIIR